MALLDMWKENRDGIRQKSLHQLLAFAGEGKLADGNACQREFHELLSEVELDVLRRYSAEALNGEADTPGLALQDIVNALGVRLGFQVEHGRYRGRQGESGHDGLWTDSDTKHSIIVEVKSTSAYPIRLKTIAKYQAALADVGKVHASHCSALIIVGHKDEDTLDLEAQIRGSRHAAGDVRVISLEGLFKMVAVKNDTDDPAAAKLLRGVLVPKEYTKLDELLEVVSFVAQDVSPEEPMEEEAEERRERGKAREGAYVSKLDKESLRQEALRVIRERLGQEIGAVSRSLYKSKDGQTAICYGASQPYPHPGFTAYWFAFHDHHAEFMKKHAKGFVAYFCTNNSIVLMPWNEFSKHVPHMGESTKGGRHWRHVYFKHLPDSAWEMRLRARTPGNPVNVSRLVVPMRKEDPRARA